MKNSILTKALLVSGFLLLSSAAVPQVLNEGTFKIGRTLSLIESYYVDTTDIEKLTEKAIVEILRNLDPHSTYISAKDVKEMNEPLTGNFEGVGIQFNLLRDSIIVIEPISGGPSEKVGIRAGDRILTIDREKVTGINITTSGVRNRLLGAKGTKVDVTVFRRGEPDILEFSIIRDKIPIHSLDAAYMLNRETGYIKLNRFAATTEQEFMDAVNGMRKKNMQNIILDLRGNGGGYMLAATSVVDKFFRDKNLIVYLSGRKTPRQDYKSNGAGALASNRIVVLTDEQSASASEIVAGAIQDWDRGVIVGRRTFGKGLVQNGFYLTDGSMIRLTIARYYTPSGRLIQSPYDEGYDKYIENYVKRFTDGELMHSDSIHFADSIKYLTLVNHRTVYGGGGIMPDVFVGADTSSNSDYFRKLAAKNVLNTYALEYFDRNRAELSSKYRNFEDFKNRFAFSEEDVRDLIKKGESENIKFEKDQFDISRNEILLILKGLLATNMWETNEYFQIINDDDKVIKTALEIVGDRKRYDSILGID